MDRNALDPGGVDDNDVYGRALARDPSNADLQLAWLTEIARRSQLEEANAPGPFRQAAPNFMAWVDRIPGAFAGMRSPQGVAIGRDNVLARQLDHKARMTEGVYDKGITGGMPHGVRTAGDWYYDPIARSSSGLLYEPGMRPAGLAAEPYAGHGYRAPWRDPANGNLPEHLRVIPGGKKD
jgi:hypothetical protein